MPTQNQDLRYRLLGEDVSAGRTFRKVAGEAQSAHSAIGLLGQSLNATGTFTPLQQGLDAISQGFQHIQENGRRTAVVMQGIGIGVAAVGAAFLAIGGKEQQAAAGLEQSIKATGASFDTFKGQIEETIKTQERYGHAANDTEDALSRLVQATNSPREALQLMGLAADVAAARHISLNDAASTLAQGLAGNTRAFRQFGITLDGVGSKSQQIQRAFDALQQKLGGQAQAQADTFSGKIRAIGVHFEDAAASMAKFSPLLLTVGSAMTITGAATDMLNRKRTEQALLDRQVIIGEDGVATAEGRAAVAAAAAATRGLPDLRAAVLAESSGASGLFRGILPTASAGAFSLGGTSLLRAGGMGIGGMLAGQVATGLVGGQTGSTLGAALTGAGLGAAVGSVVPVIGTGIGALVGGVGGALYGGLGYHDPAQQHAQQMKLQLGQLDAAQNARAMAAFGSFLPGEFDPLGNPKAAKVATANEALAKAKERLARAQDDLNKKQAAGQDPLKLEAATAHLVAAEANLEKAKYVGGDARIAAATAAVDQAQARVGALHAGVDSTAAQRRVADARQAVTDAQRRAQEARTGVTGLTAAQLLGRQRGNLRTENLMVTDQQTLVDRFHLAQPIVNAIDAADKQIPGTLHRVAMTMTRSLAEQFNRNQAAWDSASQAFREAGARAMTSAAQALGTQLAEDQMRAYARTMRRLGTASPVPMGAPYRSGSQVGGLPGLLNPGIHIGTVTVQANDPNKFTRDLEKQARFRNLGTPGMQRTVGGG